MSSALGLRVALVFGCLVAACSQTTDSGSAAASGGFGGTPLPSEPGGAGSLSAQAGQSGAPLAPEPGAAGAADTSAEAGSVNEAGSRSTASGNTLTPATWKVLAESSDAGPYANTPSAASRAADGAVAYVEQADTTPPTGRVVLQRFDSNGDRLGALVELGTDATQTSEVSLASDGQQYAACWTSGLEVHCSLFDAQGQVKRNALALEGQYPTLAASATGWVVAFATSDSQVRLQSLSPTLRASGSPVDLELSTKARTRQSGPAFAPTPSGFALIGGPLADGHDGLFRLDRELHQIGDATPLGRDLWFATQLLVTDQRAAVSLSTPYGSYLLLLQGTQLSAELRVAGGGKNGMDHALVMTEGGIGAAWLNRDGELLRRFFADGHDSEVGLQSHSSTEPLLSLPEEGSNSYQQLVRVAGRTLLVGRRVRYGSLSAAIRVTPIEFP